MTRILQWFLRNVVAANLLMAVLIVAGIAAILTVTVRTFPEIATGAVTVTVAYPGVTPSEVESAILIPIEERLEGLEGVRKLTSTASQSLGTVTADLLESADIRAVKDDIETEVARITTSPQDAESPRIVEVEPTELAVQFALYGDVSARDLKALAQRMRDDLTALPDVSQVSISGVPADQIDIEVRRETLKAYGFGLTQLADILRAENVDLSAGRIDTGADDLQVRTLGEAETADGLRDKIIASGEGGAQVRLGDIADIRETLAEAADMATVSGQRALFVSVNRAGSEQVLAVADAAIAYVEDTLRPRLPDGVEIEIWRDEADSLRGRIDLLAKNAAIGAALIFGVLLLFLDLRIAAWVAAGVIISFIGAFAPMLFFGVTINQLSLFGFILALGIVVDDAIVVGENTYSELERAGDGDAAAAAERGIRRVWRPILFSVTTTIFAFVPLLFLPGSSGSFIAPVAAVVIFVLAVSLIESFFILPKHLSHISTGPPRRFSPRRLTDWLRGVVDARFKRFSDGPLRRVVGGSVAHPVFAICLCVAVAIATIGLMAGGYVKFVFFPEIEGDFVTAELRMPEGTSEEETLRRAAGIAQAASEAAEQIGEDGLLRATAIVIGFARAGGDPGASGGVATGRTATIEARLKAAGAREADAAAFQRAWREAADEVPGARELIFSASLVGVGAAIELQVAGEDDDARDAVVARLREALAQRPGVRDIRDDRFTAAREVVLELRDGAQLYGVSQASLSQEIRAALFGARIDQVARDREEVDIRLRLPPEQRDSIADLQRLEIATDRGTVPLPILADLDFRPASSTITRIDGRAITTLTADVDTATTTGGVETSYLMSEVAPGLRQDYPGVSISTGGEQEEQARFGAALGFNALLALFAIYATLALAFGSYGRPIIILLVIPFGLIGAILGHALLGINLTLLSMFGIIGLAGVTINDSLLILDFAAEAEADGADPQDAIEQATISRFRPIVLTTVTTFLGVTPLILEPSVQAQFLIPTAVALGFGVLFVSLLQMILVPALASLYATGRRRLIPSRAAGSRDPGH